MPNSGVMRASETKHPGCQTTAGKCMGRAQQSHTMYVQTFCSLLGVQVCSTSEHHSADRIHTGQRTHPRSIAMQPPEVACSRAKALPREELQALFDRAGGIVLHLSRSSASLLHRPTGVALAIPEKTATNSKLIVQFRVGLQDAVSLPLDETDLRMRDVVSWLGLSVEDAYAPDDEAVRSQARDIEERIREVQVCFFNTCVRCMAIVNKFVALGARALDIDSLRSLYHRLCAQICEKRRKADR